MPIKISQFTLPSEERAYRDSEDGTKYRELIQDLLGWLDDGEEFLHVDDIKKEINHMINEKKLMI